jgi:hypothetical protein
VFSENLTYRVGIKGEQFGPVGTILHNKIFGEEKILEEE